MDPASLAALVLLIATAVLLIIGTPIAIAVGVASALATVVIFSPEQAALTMSQRIFTGINSFPLLAIPFFVLAGVIMNTGGIALRLVDAAKVLVGRMPGPLLQANVASNAMFGAVSGSAVAAAAAVGSTIAPLQKKEGYDARFATATNIASAPAGMLIPPSNTLIVYSLVSSTSVAALFIAGYIPGILWALACAVVAILYARRRPELAIGRLPGLSVALKAIVAAVPAMFMIVVVVGGILFGFFTPTEAAVIAVLYSLVLAFVYRAIKIRDLPGILLESTKTTAIVMFLIGVSSSMSWVMSYAQIPAIISDGILAISDSRVVVMLLITLALLVVGTFMDATPAVLIFTPIFLPVALSFGIDPVHFGILIVFNLCVGVITPPVGTVLFVGARIGKVEMESVIRPMLGYYAAIFAVLLLVVYVPDLSLWLPRLLQLM
jgi:tripartite ATP-independent transporter DctM subunit